MEASEVEHIWRESYVTKTSNGQFNHDEDFGPETDVDGVHDVLTTGFPADAAKAKALVVQSQAMEEWLPSKFEPSQKEFLKSLPWTYADALKKPKPESPKKVEQQKDIIFAAVPSIICEPAQRKNSDEDCKPPENVKDPVETSPAILPEPPNNPEETGNDVVAAEVEDGSEDDSEDEWNYVSGKNNKKPDKKLQVETVERSSEDLRERQGEDDIDDEDDMSRLNPDAAPFVPVFGEKLDKVLASSPAKGAEKSLDDVQVPQANDFLDEIASKPAELESLSYEVNLNESSVNGIDVTVDSTKAECGDDISDEELKEHVEASPAHDSNPFAEDTIQHQMVSDYFSESQNLGFKPFDPMQESMVVLDSTPSPAGDLCDFGQNDKPDLLSPIDNLTTPNDQQTPSSGFESESADEVAPERCDLVAGIPQDGEQRGELIDTNPFSMDSMQQIHNSFEPSGFFDKPCVDSHNLDVVQEEKSLDEIDQTSQIPAQTFDHVDLISGMASEISSEVQHLENSPKVDIDTQPDVARFGQVDIVVESEEIQNDFGSERIVACEEQKEQNLLNVEDKSKEESGDSDGFEIISHEEAEVGHHAMNGVHVDDESPDNYKMDDFVQHSVQIHEAPKSLEDSPAEVKNEDFFGSTDYRQELDVSAVESATENPKDFLASFDGSESQQPDVLHEIQQPEQKPEIQHDAFEDVFTKSSFSTYAAEIEPRVEEITSQVEDLSLEDKISPAEPAEEVFAQGGPEFVERESTELQSNASVVDSIVNEDLLAAPAAETQLTEELHATPLAESPLTEEVQAAPVAESPLTEDLQAAPVAESPLTEDLQAAPVSEPSPTEDLPGAPSTQPVEEMPDIVEKLVEQESPVDKPLESPVDLSVGAVQEASSDLPEDFGKQNGHISDVCTPPSTPAPGIETDESKDGLIAAAVAAAGAATVAAAATGVMSKGEEKVEKKPAAGKTASKPSATKAPAKPAAATSTTKKPTTAAKAPVSALKAAPAKPAGTVKAAPAKPTTTKPASPVTKTAATTAARPKPATTTSAKPTTAAAAKPAAPRTVGVAAKPATTAAKVAPAAAKAPLAKPKTPTTTTAPIKKPSTTTVTKTTTTTTTVKKAEPAKPLAAKAPARTTTTTAPRPTSATKPASASSTTRPSSATKPAAKPLSTAARPAAPRTSTTTAAKPAPKAPSAPVKSPAKPPTPVSKTALGAKPAAPKPKPAAPTVLKKPAAASAADKTKAPTKPAPIRKPADKTKLAEKDAKEQIEPPMQEPIVSTTNGHVENGILSDESPIDIDSRPIVEALN